MADLFITDLMNVVATTFAINTEDYDGYYEIRLEIACKAKCARIYCRSDRISDFIYSEELEMPSDLTNISSSFMLNLRKAIKNFSMFHPQLEIHFLHSDMNSELFCAKSVQNIRERVLGSFKTNDAYEWTYSKDGYETHFLVFIPNACFIQSGSQTVSKIENVFMLQDDITNNDFMKTEIERRLQLNRSDITRNLRFVGSAKGVVDFSKFLDKAIPKLKAVIDQKCPKEGILFENLEQIDIKDIECTTPPTCSEKHKRKKTRLEVDDVIDLTSQSSGINRNSRNSDDILLCSYNNSDIIEHDDHQELTDVFYEVCASDGISISSDYDREDEETILMLQKHFRCEPVDRELLDKFLDKVSPEYHVDEEEISHQSPRKRKSESVDFSFNNGKQPKFTSAKSQSKAMTCSPHVMRAETPQRKRNIPDNTPSKSLIGFQVRKARPDTPMGGDSYIRKYMGGTSKAGLEKPRTSMKSQTILNKKRFGKDEVIEAKTVNDLPSDFGIPKKLENFRIPKKNQDVNLSKEGSHTSSSTTKPSRSVYGILHENEKSKKALAQLDQNIMIQNEENKMSKEHSQSIDDLTWFHDEQKSERTSCATFDETEPVSHNNQNQNEEDVVFVNNSNEESNQADVNNNPKRKRLLYTEPIVPIVPPRKKIFTTREKNLQGPDFSQPDGDPSRSRRNCNRSTFN